MPLVQIYYVHFLYLFIIQIILFAVLSSKITIKDSSNKAQTCMFCGKPQLKLARHLKRCHKDQPLIAQAMALEDGLE